MRVFEELLPEQLGDRSRLAVTDLPAVNLNDPNDFCSGPGQEKLVGDIQIESREILLHNLQILLLGQSNAKTSGILAWYRRQLLSLVE